MINELRNEEGTGGITNSETGLMDQVTPGKTRQETEGGLVAASDGADVKLSRDATDVNDVMSHANASNLAYAYAGVGLDGEPRDDAVARSLAGVGGGAYIVPELSNNEGVTVVIPGSEADGVADKVLLAFRGTSTDIYGLDALVRGDLLADIELALGRGLVSLPDGGFAHEAARVDRLAEAQVMYDRAAKLYPTADLQTTGHSLGGWLALNVARDRGTGGHVFNPGAFLGDQVDAAYGEGKSHIWTTEGDPLSMLASAREGETRHPHVATLEGESAHSLANFLSEGAYAAKPLPVVQGSVVEMREPGKERLVIGSDNIMPLKPTQSGRGFQEVHGLSVEKWRHGALKKLIPSAIRTPAGAAAAQALVLCDAILGMTPTAKAEEELLDALRKVTCPGGVFDCVAASPPPSPPESDDEFVEVERVDVDGHDFKSCCSREDHKVWRQKGFVAGALLMRNRVQRYRTKFASEHPTLPVRWINFNSIPPGRTGHDSTMIFVRAPDGRTITLGVGPGDSVDAVKAMIGAKLGHSIYTMRLVRASGRALQESDNLGCSVERDETLQVLPRMRGGMEAETEAAAGSSTDAVDELMAVANASIGEQKTDESAHSFNDALVDRIIAAAYGTPPGITGIRSGWTDGKDYAMAQPRCQLSVNDRTQIYVPNGCEITHRLDDVYWVPAGGELKAAHRDVMRAIPTYCIHTVCEQLGHDIINSPVMRQALTAIREGDMSQGASALRSEQNTFSGSTAYTAGSLFAPMLEHGVGIDKEAIVYKIFAYMNMINPYATQASMGEANFFHKIPMSPKFALCTGSPNDTTAAGDEQVVLFPFQPMGEYSPDGRYASPCGNLSTLNFQDWPDKNSNNPLNIAVGYISASDYFRALSGRLGSSSIARGWECDKWGVSSRNTERNTDLDAEFTGSICVIPHKLSMLGDLNNMAVILANAPYPFTDFWNKGVNVDSSSQLWRDGAGPVWDSTAQGENKFNTCVRPNICTMACEGQSSTRFLIVGVDDMVGKGSSGADAYNSNRSYAVGWVGKGPTGTSPYDRFITPFSVPIGKGTPGNPVRGSMNICDPEFIENCKAGQADWNTATRPGGPHPIPKSGMVNIGPMLTVGTVVSPGPSSVAPVVHGEHTPWNANNAVSLPEAMRAVLHRERQMGLPRDCVDSALALVSTGMGKTAIAATIEGNETWDGWKMTSSVGSFTAATPISSGSDKLNNWTDSQTRHPWVPGEERQGFNYRNMEESASITEAQQWKADGSKPNMWAAEQIGATGGLYTYVNNPTINKTPYGDHVDQYTIAGPDHVGLVSAAAGYMIPVEQPTYEEIKARVEHWRVKCAYMATGFVAAGQVAMQQAMLPQWQVLSPPRNEMFQDIFSTRREAVFDVFWGAMTRQTKLGWAPTKANMNEPFPWLSWYWQNLAATWPANNGLPQFQWMRSELWFLNTAAPVSYLPLHTLASYGCGEQDIMKQLASKDTMKLQNSQLDGCMIFNREDTLATLQPTSAPTQIARNYNGFDVLDTERRAEIGHLQCAGVPLYQGTLAAMDPVTSNTWALLLAENTAQYDGPFLAGPAPHGSYYNSCMYLAMPVKAPSDPLWMCNTRRLLMQNQERRFVAVMNPAPNDMLSMVTGGQRTLATVDTPEIFTSESKPTHETQVTTPMGLTPVRNNLPLRGANTFSAAMMTRIFRGGAGGSK